MAAAYDPEVPGDLLEKAINDPDLKLAEAAIVLAGSYGIKEATDPLLGVVDGYDLMGKRRTLRIKALKALGDLGDPTVLPRLDRYFRSPLLTMVSLEERRAPPSRPLPAGSAAALCRARPARARPGYPADLRAPGARASARRARGGRLMTTEVPNRDRQALERLIVHIAAAINVRALYSGAHPRVAQAVQAILDDLTAALAGRESVTLFIVGDDLIADDRPLRRSGIYQSASSRPCAGGGGAADPGARPRRCAVPPVRLRDGRGRHAREHRERDRGGRGVRGRGGRAGGEAARSSEPISSCRSRRARRPSRASGPIARAACTRWRKSSGA